MDLTYSIAVTTVLMKIWEGPAAFLNDLVTVGWPVLLFVLVVAFALRRASQVSKKFRSRLGSQRSDEIRRVILNGNRFFAGGAIEKPGSATWFPCLVPKSNSPSRISTEVVWKARKPPTNPRCFGGTCSFGRIDGIVRAEEAVNKINAEKVVPSQPSRKL